MDPNNQQPPAQQPPAQEPAWGTPPPVQQPPAQQPGWGTPPPPPAPQQPAWGSPPPPPAPQQPGWGAPPQGQPGWGTPPPQQPGWGTPPQGQPGWGAPPPAAPGGRGRKRILGIVAGIVIVVVIGFVALALFGGGSGKVTFSKTTYDTAKSTCSFESTITTATSTDAVFLLADLKDTVPANGKATMEIFKDGASQGIEPISEGTEYNCYYVKSSIGPLDPGVWKVVITYNGKVEAEGSITINK
jgi:hypothetical protein